MKALRCYDREMNTRCIWITLSLVGLLLVISKFGDGNNPGLPWERSAVTDEHGNLTPDSLASEATGGRQRPLFDLIRSKRAEVDPFEIVIFNDDEMDWRSKSVSVELPAVSVPAEGDSLRVEGVDEKGIPLFTRRYRVKPDAVGAPLSLEALSDEDGRGPSAKEYLEEQGIVFEEEGATAFYMPSSSEWVVRNTLDQLQLVDDMLLESGGAEER